MNLNSLPSARIETLKKSGAIFDLSKIKIVGSTIQCPRARCGRKLMKKGSTEFSHTCGKTVARHLVPALK